MGFLLVRWTDDPDLRFAIGICMIASNVDDGIGYRQRRSSGKRFGGASPNRTMIPMVRSG
jgi:hypothetical protein